MAKKIAQHLNKYRYYEKKYFCNNGNYCNGSYFV